MNRALSHYGVKGMKWGNSTTVGLTVHDPAAEREKKKEEEAKKKSKKMTSKSKKETSQTVERKLALTVHDPVAIREAALAEQKKQETKLRKTLEKKLKSLTKNEVAQGKAIINDILASIETSESKQKK